MKVISIGTDRKIFEAGSQVRERQIEYGKLFDELHIIVFSNINQNLKTRIQISDNIYVYPTSSKNKLIYIWDSFRILKTINSQLKSSNFVMSTQDPFETGLVGLIIKLFYGIPLHVQLHTDFNNKYFVLHSPINFFRFLIAHIVLPYADSVRCVSEKVAKKVRELNKNVLVLPISQTFNIKNINLNKGFKARILTVCRLEKEKNLETAIRAFKKIIEVYPEATFTIVGDGGQRKSLGLLVKSLELESRIHFVGWQNDLDNFYNDADIYISTSLFEGYGMSVVEAALYRLPLVLSNAGIAEEYFKNKGAFICEPRDVNSFYKSLSVIFKDKEGREKMGIEAKNSAETNLLSWGKYLELYKKNIGDASTNYRKQTFLKRVFGLLSSIINGNKILRFVIAGGTSAGTQILSLYIFTDILKIWYLHSSILSFCLALIISFSLQKLWAFKDRQMSGVHNQFFKYTGVALLGLLINTIFMYVGVDIIGLWYLFTQIIAGVFIAVFNFFMYRRFIFKN